MIKVYVDAAVSKRQSKIGIGCVIYQNKTQQMLSLTKTVQVNNHEAEFIALIEILNELIAKKLTQETIFLYTDSQVVVQAINRKSAKGEWQQQYIKQLLPLIDQFNLLFVEWYSDKENQLAHQLAIQSIQSK